MGSWVGPWVRFDKMTRRQAIETAEILLEQRDKQIRRAEAAEAKLAAVQALCERNFNMEDHYEIDRLRFRLAETEGLAARWEAQADAFDGSATYWYGKWVEVSVERDDAIADRDRWRDSWESGDWSREQWERDRAQESDEARRQDAEHSPDRQHRYWPWGADDTCGVAVQDPGTRSMRACRRPKNDPMHSEERTDV